MRTQNTRRYPSTAAPTGVVLFPLCKNPNAAVIDRIINFSKTLKVKGRVNIRDLIEDGRE